MTPEEAIREMAAREALILRDEIAVALGAVMCPPEHDGTNGLFSDGSRCYVCIGRALQARCEAAEAEVARLREALERIARLAAEKHGPAIARDALAGGDSECDHEWIDARNEVVISGEYCNKCGMMRAGNK